MIRIEDLGIEKTILPLLDFTLNHFAREQLKSLLYSPQASVREITERQEIIRGMLHQQEIIREFSYSRGDLNEVHSFLNTAVGDQHYNTSTGRFNSLIQPVIDKRQYLQLKARVLQSVRLLFRLQNHYFSRLHTNYFPEKFKALLISLNDALGLLQLDVYEHKIIENSFKAKDVFSFLDRLRLNFKDADLARFWERLFLFEAWLSLAKATDKYRFAFPVFRDDRGLALKNFYHPLLKDPVKSSIDTAGDNVILITGPNMSGKSTLLKSIALCVYLAHTGMAVPADACTLPFFDMLSVAIHHQDDIQQGYSHFMTEIMTLKEVVVTAAEGRSCFAVFDELFKGTNIEDAVAISERTIRGLGRYPSSLFFISTHLHSLKSRIAGTGVSIRYLDCTLTAQRPVFTYELKSGWSDLSIGQILFCNEGLDTLLS